MTLMQKDCPLALQWQTADPTSLGMDAEKLSALEPVIKDGYSNISGIVVVRRGAIAYERYYNGFGPEDARHVTSVTKSILSALIGIAIDAGYIRSADQKVLDFFPEYAFQDENENRQRITIRHLLTMTAPYPFADWQEPFEKLCSSPDWVKFALDMLGQGGSIGTFKYSSAGAHLLSAILTRSTGKSARAFANERLFKPVGMKEIPDDAMKGFGFDDLFGKNVKGWVKDPGNHSTGGWGLTLTPRDMARFGLLYLNRGVWGNDRIISEAWIEESTTPHTTALIDTAAVQYGYLWWLYREGGVSAAVASGDGGNMICCIPEKDLVVAIASEFIPNARDRQALVREYILPAIID